jgi:hypothetical protein
VSVGVMALATITGPLTGVEYSVDTWFDRLGRGETVETLVGRLGVGSGVVAAVPFAVALAVALGLSLARLPLLAGWRAAAPMLAGVVGAWLLVVLVAPDLLPADEAHGTDEGAIAVLVLLATIAMALHVGRRSAGLGLLVLAPAFVLALPALAARPRMSLLVALVVLAGAAALSARLRRIPVSVALPTVEVPLPTVERADIQHSA